jgi:hypothetical protein|tara:strand:- start:71 stop:295 length:225 start_codon:yes stop_codon:yes gene_type:complete
VVKVANNNYTLDMALFKDFLDIPKVEGWSGQDIYNLIENVHDDYNFYLAKKRSDPDRVIYYRDLLTYLIKTYGH